MEFQKSFFIQRLRHIHSKRSDIVPNGKESSSDSSQRKPETACPKCKFFFHFQTALNDQSKMSAWFGATTQNGRQKALSVQLLLLNDLSAYCR
jgi:hypothetical protein